MKQIKSLLKDRQRLFFAVFFLLALGAVLGSLILAIRSDGASFHYTLFFAEIATPNRDFFMDFFNSMRDASTLDVYDKGVIYPPLANLLFFFFSRFISSSLANTSFDLRLALQADQRSIMVYLLFALICVVALALILKNYFQKSNSRAVAEVMSFVFLFFYPFYYCVERGNILLLSMIASAFFIFFHNSPSKKVREFSYISLAFAAGLKIYPAFFGILLLVEKRYKAALHTILYGLLFFFVPFLFYDFGAGLFQLIDNLITFSQTNKAGFSFGSTSIMNLFYYLGDKYHTLGTAVFVLTELIALLCAFLAPQKWQRVFALTYMIINIHSVSSAYAAIFLIIPFAVFMSAETKKQRADWLYLVLFCLLLLPLPCIYYYHRDWILAFYEMLNIPYSSAVNKLLAWPCAQFMFLLVTVESLLHVIAAKKSGKKLSSFFIKTKKKKAKAPAVAAKGAAVQ